MISISTPDGLTHYLEDEAAIADIPSPNTRAALQAAIAAGQVEPYTPPDLEPEPSPPDWPAFRLALLQSTTFRAWSEVLPTTWREDLKLAAIAANEEALQGIYTLLIENYTPSPTAVDEWQAIADTNHIPITF